MHDGVVVGMLPMTVVLQGSNPSIAELSAPLSELMSSLWDDEKPRERAGRPTYPPNYLSLRNEVADTSYPWLPQG